MGFQDRSLCIRDESWATKTVMYALQRFAQGLFFAVPGTWCLVLACVTEAGVVMAFVLGVCSPCEKIGLAELFSV